MIQLPNIALYKLSGPDTGDFLHGQLTADTGALADGESRFAAYCSPKGQVIAILLVCRLDSDWLIAMDSELADRVVKRLKMYVLRARVEFHDMPDWRLHGLPEHETGSPGSRVFSPIDTPLRYVTGVPSAPDMQVSLKWRHKELLSGISWLQAATSERFIPQMLGLEHIGALSFSKGCYPGQEIVARTHYLGKVKRKPLLLECSGTPAVKPADKITLRMGNESRNGIVVDAVCPDGKSTTVLAVAPGEENEKVQQLEFEDQSWPAHRLAISAN